MFGKKKSSDESKAPTPVAAKKQKAANDSGGIKGFFVYHGEKLVLAVVAGLLCWMVYDGMGVETYDPSKTPDSLRQTANSVARQLEEDHWANIEAEPERSVDTNITSRVQASRRPTDPTPYETRLWQLEPTSSGAKRNDPEVLAALNVVGSNFYGAMCILDERGPRSLRLPPAPEPGEWKDYQPNSPDTESLVAREIPMSFDHGFDVATIEEQAANQRAGSRGGRDGKSGGMPGMPGGMPGGPAGMSGGGAGMDIGGGGGDGNFSGGGPGGTASRSNRMSQVELPEKIDGEPTYVATNFNVVTAVVPHETMSNNYSKTFINSSSYDPGRDSPNYLGFEVQRVDVTGKENAEVTEEMWQDLDSASSKQIIESTKAWAGQCGEVVKEDYVTSYLSMPIPPILIRDYTEVVRHPMTPVDGEPEPGQEEAEEEQPTGGYGGYSGYDSNGDDDRRDYEGENGDPRGGRGGGRRPQKATESLAKSSVKLVRFYDFEAEPGHSYKYRVRVIMDDPNYPMDPLLQPALPSLSKETLARILDMKTKDDKAFQAAMDDPKELAKVKRSSGIPTDWSPASPAIYSRSGNELLAGEAKIFFAETIRGATNSTYATRDIEAMAVLAAWDADRAVFVSREDLIQPGDVMSGIWRGDDDEMARIVDPMSHEILVDEDYEFENPVTVLEIAGGKSLAMGTTNRDPLLTVTEILGFNSSTGELLHSSEFADFERNNLYSFSFEKPKEEPAGGSPGNTGPGGIGGGGAGMPGMPGAGGGLSGGPDR
jgi:hypothetical protein